MKTVKAQQITSAVKNLCIEANCYLPEDVQDIIKKSCDEETFPIANDILKKLEENYRIASCEKDVYKRQVYCRTERPSERRGSY